MEKVNEDILSIIVSKLNNYSIYTLHCTCKSIHNKLNVLECRGYNKITITINDEFSNISKLSNILPNTDIIYDTSAQLMKNYNYLSSISKLRNITQINTMSSYDISKKLLNLTNLRKINEFNLYQSFTDEQYTILKNFNTNIDVKLLTIYNSAINLTDYLSIYNNIKHLFLIEHANIDYTLFPNIAIITCNEYFNYSVLKGVKNVISIMDQISIKNYYLNGVLYPVKKLNALYDISDLIDNLTIIGNSNFSEFVKYIKLGKFRNVRRLSIYLVNSKNTNLDLSAMSKLEELIIDESELLGLTLNKNITLNILVLKFVYFTKPIHITNYINDIEIFDWSNNISFDYVNKISISIYSNFYVFIDSKTFKNVNVLNLIVNNEMRFRKIYISKDANIYKLKINFLLNLYMSDELIYYFKLYTLTINTIKHINRIISVCPYSFIELSRLNGNTKKFKNLKPYILTFK